MKKSCGFKRLSGKWWLLLITEKVAYGVGTCCLLQIQIYSSNQRQPFCMLCYTYILWSFLGVGYTIYRSIILNLQFLSNIIINQTKVLFPQAYVALSNFGYLVNDLLFYCSQNFKLLDFPIFVFWEYPMNVFPETCRVH